MIHLRAFQAIDDEARCMDFADGHRKVLEGFNLGNISTNNVSWAYNPNVYVVMAYDGEDDILLGGIRLQIADGTIPLPVETAIAHFDSKIHDMVGYYAQNGGTSELCGLWNNRCAAPNMGVTVNLVIAGMALCNQLPITSIFTIVGTQTLRIARQMGFKIEASLGNHGEFNYPNSNYIARVLSMNPQTLDHTHSQYYDKISNLRSDPYLERMEKVGEDSSVIYTHDLELKKKGRIRNVV